MCGHDVNGNRYCFKHCPLIEMAFLHEPVHAFQTSFENASHQQKPFSVSCLTVFDEPGDEMLLHICHPEQNHSANGPSTTSPSTSPRRTCQAGSRSPGYWQKSKYSRHCQQIRHQHPNRTHAHSAPDVQTAGSQASEAIRRDNVKLFEPGHHSSVG